MSPVAKVYKRLYRCVDFKGPHPQIWSEEQTSRKLLNIMLVLWQILQKIDVYVDFRGLYYPPEVSSMKYCCLGVFRKEYFRLVTN